MDISLENIQAAHRVISKTVLRSPLIPLIEQQTKQNQKILLKAECLQPSGSFKIRGATYCLSLLTPEQRKRGIITYSTGNHSQAVALASKQYNAHAIIVMSPDAPGFKIEATKHFGAHVIMTEPSSQVRRQLAEGLAQKEGYALIPAYDDINVITGQGTIGLEIAEEITPSAVFVPIGGGGLIAGIAAAIKMTLPKTRIIGVEPELENDAYRSFKEGKRIVLESASNSIADAVRVMTLGNLTYPLICKYVDDIITVTEEQIAKATLICVNQAHLFTEPAGALALAGALLYTGKLDPGPVVCIASGGNTTLEALDTLGEKMV
jgi:threonine dehydratase